MSNELAVYKTLDGEDMSLTIDDVRKQFCPNATDQELAQFGALAKACGANPFKREIYLVKYKDGSPASIILSYHMFNRIAQRHEDYNGIESGVIVADSARNICTRNGGMFFSELGETLLGGWAQVYRKGIDHPFYVAVRLSEYTTGRNNWAKMPATMVEKVAKSQAWRLAYPDDFSGVYSREEMGAKERDEQSMQPQQAQPVQPTQVQPAQAPAPQPQPKKLSPEHAEFMRRTVKAAADMTGLDQTELSHDVMEACGNPLAYDNDQAWTAYAANVAAYVQTVVDGVLGTSATAPAEPEALAPDDIEF